MNNRYKNEIEKILVDIEKMELSVLDLKHRIQKKHEILAIYKANILTNNKHLIGKWAKVILENGTIMSAECNDLMVDRNFDLRPLFKSAGKKLSIQEYEWI
jgi:hypothetical protein